MRTDVELTSPFWMSKERENSTFMTFNILMINSSMDTARNNLSKSFTQLVDLELRLSHMINSIDISKEKSQREDFSASDLSTHSFIYYLAS